MAYKREYSEIRRKAKIVNERMRQLEKKGIKSPAYKAAQAKLEMLGKDITKSGGRRFSEKSYYEYREAEAINKVLDDILGYKTSTLTGAKNYYDTVWKNALANPTLRLKESGITREQWFEFWENMPNKEKDRMFESSQVVSFLTQYVNKHGKLENENAMSAKEIAETIQASGSLSAAYDALGLDMLDNDESDDLGFL